MNKTSLTIILYCFVLAINGCKKEKSKEEALVQLFKEFSESQTNNERLMLSKPKNLVSFGETGKELNTLDDSLSALHLAVLKRDLEAVKALVVRNVNINSKNKDGVTPLHIAVRIGQIKVIQLLIDKGADTKAKTVNGETPLTIAKEWGLKDVEDLLRKHVSME